MIELLSIVGDSTPRLNVSDQRIVKIITQMNSFNYPVNSHGRITRSDFHSMTLQNYLKVNMGLL